MSKWYGSVLYVGDNRWPKQMLMCCPEKKKKKKERKKEKGKAQNKA
jgi:hypothetical protein